MAALAAAKKSRKIILIDHEELQPKRPKVHTNDRAALEDPLRSSAPFSNGAPVQQEPGEGASTQQLAGREQRLSATPSNPSSRPPSGSLPRPGWPSHQEGRKVGNQGPPSWQHNVNGGTETSQEGFGPNRLSHRPQLQASGGPAPRDACTRLPPRPDFGQKVHAWQHPGKRASAAPKASPMLERLQAEATCQRLWDPTDESNFEPLPGEFPSVDAYIAAFEPFVFEECRAELRQEWQEVCDGSKNHYEVVVTSVDKYDTGDHDVRLTLRNPTIRLGAKKDASSLQFREGAVAVLTPAKPDLIDRRRGMQRSDSDKEDEEGSQMQVAGVVMKYQQGELRGDADWLVMRVYADRGQAGTIRDTAQGSQSVAAVELLKKKGNSKWWFTPLSNLVTNQREYEGLHSIRNFQGLMKAAILKPKQEFFPKYTEQEAPTLTGWLTPSFAEHLQRSFNPPQLASIKWSAAHVAAGARGKGSQAAPEEVWPFTLIQGPPGTGKTHTVWGILNVVHLVQYQRYFASLLQKLAPDAVASSEEDLSEKPKPLAESEGSLDSILSNMDASLKRILPQLSPKPRLLVCAPSNAATDELLARVLDRGFIDGELRSYKPNVARVGLDFGSPAAQAVSVERRANQLLSMAPEQVHRWIQQLQQNEHALRYRMSVVQKELAGLTAVSKGGAVGMEPEHLTAQERGRDAKLQELAARREEHDKVLVDLERFLIVGEKYRQGGGGYRQTEGQLRRQLETSFAREAEIVFTTLSSSGREIFERLGHGFDTVVIDEAAQASEMAILPPLRLGCNRCILVGDPQQLPATVISQEAQSMLFSRSLFERFQLAGCPALMLTQQYRMHSLIREFPSRFFYDSRLTDDESVTARPEEPYHRDPLLRPYVFFDVSKGKEKQGGRSMSLQNRLEADFAVLLYSHFRASLPAGALPRLSVGAITPYKQQSTTLKRAFDPIVADIAKESASITINTVDAYQGQERDIVLLSCVRASPKGGVGFVADVRRMNVALTRARRSLWILGNAASLSRNPDWEALIQDAKVRGCYVDASTPEALFSPELVAQVKALQATEQGAIEDFDTQAQASSRKRHKGTGLRSNGQALVELANDDNRRQASNKGASTSGLESARNLYAETRRNLPSRDPRRAVLSRPPAKPPGVASLGSDAAISGLLSSAPEFRPPSPTPQEVLQALGDPPVQGRSMSKETSPSGLEQVERARRTLASLGVEMGLLDSVRWGEVEKRLDVMQEHAQRLQWGGGAVQSSICGPLERQPSATTSNSGTAQTGGSPARAGLQGAAPSSSFGAQHSVHTQAAFAPRLPLGQPFNVSPSVPSGDLMRQSSDPRAAGSLSNPIAAPPSLPSSVANQGRDLVGSGHVGAGIRAPGVRPALLEPSANGVPRPRTALPPQHGNLIALGRSKPSKKQKKGWRNHVDRDQLGGAHALSPQVAQGMSQAAHDPSAHLWNTQELMGGGLNCEGKARLSTRQEGRDAALPDIGVESKASPQDAGTPSKRQWQFDLNSIPDDADVDAGKGPPGFAPPQQQTRPD